MIVLELKRVFRYNGITLADPNPGASPDTVMATYAIMYPELANAVLEGPVIKDGVATYTFLKAVGTKGAGDKPALSGAKLLRAINLARSQVALAAAAPPQSAGAEHALALKGAFTLAGLAGRRTGGRPLAIGVQPIL